MSIDLNWDTLTGGPDGAVLAEQIRDFIHTKFQSVPLPRFIKSVTVHDFQFGSIPPRIVLKDICDPLPDFYEEEFDEDEDDDGGDDGEEGEDGDPADEAISIEAQASRTNVEEYVPDAIRAAERRRKADLSRRLDVGGIRANGHGSRPTTPVEGYFGHIPPLIHTAGLRSAPATPTPGIPGGTSNMHYFQSKLASGWSGTQTPLAAVAGAQHMNGWLDASGLHSTSSSPPPSSSRYSRSPGPGQSNNNNNVNNNNNSNKNNSSNNNNDTRPPRPPSLGSISAADFPSPSSSSLALPVVPLREKHSVSTLAPTSAGASRPPTRDRHAGGKSNSNSSTSNLEDEDEDDEEDKYHERRVDDMQAVFRIRYAGDIKLMLTAEILLDYPMPSFVGIPVKLNITGLTFDGVGVVANIRRRVHFCFLSPEDALAAVGDDDDDDDEEDEEGQQGGNGNGISGAGGYFPPQETTSGRGRQRYRDPYQQQRQTPPAGTGANAGGERQPTAATTAGAGGGRKPRGRMGGLLQEIRVESEIGQREGAKQSLKNVGKVEKFVLEQVRRIFEEEFVYPSFWTFLV
ncbi:hypothetical protein F5X96DRAFT_634759 [Biscogniauxia mediterranea]|nr:hypothetical protein F5X96DRAFT_634759 [Biscogniauxia mediterranea]